MVAKQAALALFCFVLGLLRDVHGKQAVDGTVQEASEVRGVARTLLQRGRKKPVVRTMNPRAPGTKPHAGGGGMMKMMRCVATSKAPTRTSMGPTRGKGTRKVPKTCTTSVLDVNGDGAEDLEDLIFVFRAIDDPFQDDQFANNTAADVNRDGVVDLKDAVAMIANLTDLLGAGAMGVLTPTYFDNVTDFTDFNVTLNDRRRLHAVAHQPMPAELKAPDFLSSRKAQGDTCGANTALSLAKGSGPDPAIPWDFSNCLKKPGLWDSLSIVKKAEAYANWTRWGIKEFLARPWLPDGTRAYRRYRQNTGTGLRVDYKKAIREDAFIKYIVNVVEIGKVKAAVKALFDGQNSFDFYSLKTQRVNTTVNENWQKAIGGHRIWSVGSVTYNAGSCSLTIKFDVKAEDYYNFNPGQRDIATGIPDNENCFFGEIGWAKGFFSRGSVTRTETVPLQCCQDTDCGRPDEFECECNLCTTQCPTNQRSGGQGFTSFTVELFKTKGTIQVSYEMYDIPDELNVYYEGATIFSTGGLVSGSATRSVQYGSNTATSTQVTVEINAPNSGTAWDVSVTCPD